MSVNRYLPHVLVLPEDDANRQIANGFLLDTSLRPRSIQVVPEAGGWLRLIESFQADEADEMLRNENRFMVLLIDLDGKADRVEEVRRGIPAQLTDRVFILGTLTEPEALRRDFGAYESIGKGMARDCREGTDTVWNHKLLRHNAGELERLRERVGPILFE